MSEQWLPIAGYEGIYEVSDLGRIRSLDRLDARGRRRTGRMRSARRQPSGHLTVSLCRDRSQRVFLVHHLVLLAFIGPRPAGMEGCHRNDIGDDNRLENLRWDTRSANALDCVRNGGHAMANKTHCPEGHPYTPANTYVYPAGNRACRECRRIYREAHAEERRAKGREYMRRKRAATKSTTTGKAA